jgi:hypothetical protein
MKFKTEVCLLMFAITLFAVSMLFYSYQNAISDQAALNLAAYPYRGIALGFVGMGSVLTVTASVSYSKRSKNILN